MKVNVSSIIENQFPEFLKTEAPLLIEFITQYFISQDVKFAPNDLISNLTSYTNIENLTDQIKSTVLNADVAFDDSTIMVESTEGFPSTYGLLRINSEIITYTSKTETTFDGCVRGFSGIYNDQLDFTTSESDFHTAGDNVENLSILLLEKFLDKIKKELIPGFEGRELIENLNETTFIQKSKSFYTSKGTDTSFDILFKVLYGEPVKVIYPREYLFTPSAAEYRVSKNLVVESVLGDPQLLENGTLFQDDVNGNNVAKGAVSKVEKILRGDKTYYVISLDYDFNVSGSVFGEFYIHAKSQLTSSVSIDQETIDVDSTAGFPESGSLLINNVLIEYTSKSITQFFGCSNVTEEFSTGTEVYVNDFAYGYVGNTAVAVRVSGIISDFTEIESANLINVGDKIRVKSLGIRSNDIRTQPWIYNIPVFYNIKSLILLDSNTSKYQLETIDENNLVFGDAISIFLKDNTKVSSKITSKVNETTVVIEGQGSLNFSNINYIERVLSKADALNYPEISSVSTNIQNVYENGDDIYVATSSIPTYFDEQLAVADRSIKITSNATGYVINSPGHGFLSGDIIAYDYAGNNNHLGIARGTYYIKKNSVDSLSLASSSADLATNSLIKLSGTATSGISTISYNNLYNKKLKNQKLFRLISKATPTQRPLETPIGNVGILNNGVEIVNYKSKDTVFYGPIQSIDIVAPGEDYDVINPPKIITVDSTGSGLIAECEIVGSLKEIRLIDRGLNFTEEPSIKISGGNGTGAKAKVEVSSFEHSASFDSSSIINNAIGFSTYHGFNTAEKIIYKPDGTSRVIGITTDAEYFASKIDDSRIRLHKTEVDSISGINTISLSYSGFTVHRFVSAEAKTKISTIVIVDEGTGYTNRRISIPASGISTASSTFNRVNHGFKTGERIVYESYTDSPIVGIATNKSYYVTTENDYFRLSEVATAGISTSEDFLFKTKQYVPITSSGIGTHYFNYEPIKVELTSNSGISSLSAQIQPIFRGEIVSASIVNGGKNYGQEDILNYNRQPDISLFSGSGAIIQAIVVDGKINQVLIIDSGSGYYAPPTILINGDGRNAKLTPIVQNGELIDVKIINPGYGYNPLGITLTVVSAGHGGVLRTNAKPWTINLIERLISSNQIGSDDGILVNSINSLYELQYVHGYAPRYLRSILSSKTFVSGVSVYHPDLRTSRNVEIRSRSHSPIIGWAYDGNPIYGPYGFNTETEGRIRYMESGYRLISNQTNRPSTALYPEGMFVEDYIFSNDGDLDEHNGRYCITPEFPNGTYAYFSTIEGNAVQSSGPFANYFRPKFPYFIGETYKSSPISFNFNHESNQDSIDLNKTSWLRNTQPYHLNSQTGGYNYILKPYAPVEQTATVNSTIPGSIDDIGIISGGDNYKVGDKIVFSNENTGGENAKAVVSEIKGKTINFVSIASTTSYNVEFSPHYKRGIVGVSTLPHGFNNNDTITISDLNKNQNILEGAFKVAVEKNSLILMSDLNTVATTGITTYLNVYGKLGSLHIRENDVYQIDNEKVKVLTVEDLSSRIFVERAVGGSVGAYHTTGAVLLEVPRRFFLNESDKDFDNPILNKQIFFNPKESVGVGLGTTIVFSNPGAGITNIFVPTRSIYLKEHKLLTNDELRYELNGGSNLIVSNNGITTFPLLNNTTVYTVKYSNDFIGISTEKVGVGTTGNWVGYNTTAAAKILYYHTFGSGSNHSFNTNYQSTKGQASRNIARVFTASDPELRENDFVNISVKPSSTKTVKVVYNKARELLLLNPRTILASSINTTENYINVDSHNYFTGQKVLYTSDNPMNGLVNDGLYFVVVRTPNSFSLSRSYYDSQLEEPIVINFTNATRGAIYEVNPRVTVIKNQTLIFDLSDSSLSVFSGSQKVPAFEFDLFLDNDFVNKFVTTGNATSFNVKKTGTIGVSNNARLTLTYDSEIPLDLYYNLSPLNTLNIFVDSVNNFTNNSISYINSEYSGVQAVSGVGTTSFYYNVSRYPEVDQYTQGVTYTTSSKTATGPIEDVKIISSGRNYKTPPGISSVISQNGSGAILEVLSGTIGKINNVTINDVGYDYPSDLTLAPLTQTPVVLKIIPQTTLKSIKILSQGKNYLTAPDLVLIDGLSLEHVEDVDLRYTYGDTEVQIVRNSKGINNVSPILIPTNNTNGIKITSVSYNSTEKEVTAVLSESYSTLSDFPFKVGEKILVENIAILDDLDAKGFNSASYEYARFTIVSITPNLGFAGGSVTYSMKDYLKSNDYPGTPDPSYTSGSLIPETFFPIFDVTLEKNIFFKDEVVTYNNFSGIVQNWNKENELLTVSTADEFQTGMKLTASGSLSSGIIDKIYDFNSKYSIGASAIVREGWRTEKGFIDNEFQHIPDNDYYQNFSYALKSKIDYNTWSEAVGSLNHTAGFKKFSNLIVESEEISDNDAVQEDSMFEIVVSHDSEIDLNCLDDFDLATENRYLVDNVPTSNEIYFNSKILQDYSQAVSNRALILDDISPQFDGIKKEFQLYSNNLRVFSRTFDGEDESVISISGNLLNINNHFFTTGEKIRYINNGESLGINTVTISGIGLTDKLPTELYIIKYSESTIGFSDSAENALKEPSVPLVLRSVGVGNVHILKSLSQNTKSVITLGGVIQSPLSPTEIVTNLSANVGIASSIIFFNSIDNFSSGDISKINDEIVKIISVGVGSTNSVFVERAIVGTITSEHLANSPVYKLSGDYNIVTNSLNFVEAPKGPQPIGTTTGLSENVDYSGITTTLSFSGRVFLKTGEPNTNKDAYSNNYVFDDISNSFNGISTTFILKSNGSNTSGFENNNAVVLVNEIFQSPSELTGSNLIYGSYELDESAGITTIRFLSESNSQNYLNIPIGGSIVSFGYTGGTGLQPLVAAGGTAIVSAAGTIQSVSIGNSGSGYRSGFQNVNVGVYSTDGEYAKNIGIASISNGRVISVAITDPGIGYTSTNPPFVKFDDPLPYTNLNVSYISPTSGIGTQAIANISVGMGSSIIDFDFIKPGFAYKRGDILTVSIGGTTGIPTTGSNYSPLVVRVDEVYNQKFSGWTFGKLQLFDTIENLFNGNRNVFPLKVDGVLQSIQTIVGSPINLNATFLVFINGVLQVPDESYTIFGGSYISFSEAPRAESFCSIMFYRGNGVNDVIDVDIIAPLKAGDMVKLNDDTGLGQNKRFITDILSSNSVETIQYNGPNVIENYLRPATICMQTEDLFINGKEVSKEREIYEPIIEPTTNIIKTVGVTTNIIFVENMRTFFNDNREAVSDVYKNALKVITQDQIKPAIASPIVSTSGTITGVIINDGGVGYTTAPIVTIAPPLGFSTEFQATAIASVSNSSISSITVLNSGGNYSSSQPPQILVSNPINLVEDVVATTIGGDFGLVVGIQSATVGVASTALKFTLFIPPESVLKNPNVVGENIIISSIKPEYYFVIKNTFIGDGITSLDGNGSVISIGSSYLDNVYKVSSVSVGQTSVAGIGATHVVYVTTNVSNNSFVGMGVTRIYGTYSWGRVVTKPRSKAKEFVAYNNGLPGISTSAVLKRNNPLKSSNYTGIGTPIEPSLPPAPLFDLAYDTGSSATDKISSNGLINVTGLVDGSTWEYSINSGSSWTAGIGATFNLSEGVYSIGTIRLRQTDLFGNTSAPPSQNSTTFIIDQTIVSPTFNLVEDTGSSNTDKITYNGLISVSGIETGATWQYSINSGSSWATGIGTTFTLSEGSYSSGMIRVRQTDIAGNTATAQNSETFVIDQTIVAPVFSLIQDTGSSNSDKITSNGLIGVSGIETGATWQYSTNSGSSWATGIGTTFTLSEGTYSAGLVRVRQTDIAGNTATAQNSDTIIIDNTALPLSFTLAEDTGSSNTDRITYNGTLFVTGIETGATWQYSTNSGSSWSTGIGTTFGLTEGTYSAGVVRVRQTDISGNTSSAAQNSGTIVIDQTILAPVFGLLEDTGSSNSDGISTNGLIGVSGIETGATWQYSVNSGSNWVTGIGTTFTLSVGTYSTGTVRVRQTDIAGNTASAQSQATIVIEPGGGPVLQTCPSSLPISTIVDAGNTGYSCVLQDVVYDFFDGNDLVELVAANPNASLEFSTTPTSQVLSFNNVNCALAVFSYQITTPVQTITSIAHTYVLSPEEPSPFIASLDANTAFPRLPSSQAFTLDVRLEIDTSDPFTEQQIINITNIIGTG
jgi:hypothetical protein